MNEISTVSLVGLGNIGMRYDFLGGKFLGTAKSHIGAFLAIPNLKMIYGVDEAFDPKFLSSHISSSHFLLYDEFASSKLSYDLLVLATPTSTHLEIVENLVRKHRFKSVILEKPCGSNLAECKSILDLLEQKGISWQVNYFRSVLPNTQEALKKTHVMKIRPSSAIITGYGDLLNIFSHFIHLMLLFIEPDRFIFDDFESHLGQINIKSQCGFKVELHNIGGEKKEMPILSLMFDSYVLVFSENGQTIKLIHAETNKLAEAFILKSLDSYQEIATIEYLRKFACGLSDNRQSVEKVHEIIAKVNF